jgi:hypothetical protein
VAFTEDGQRLVGIPAKRQVSILPFSPPGTFDTASFNIHHNSLILLIIKTGCHKSIKYNLRVKDSSVEDLTMTIHKPI